MSMSEFAPKAGCTMCGIVAAASASNFSANSSASARSEILWRDDNFTVYREEANPVSSKGHIVIVFNLHVSSIYRLSSSDLPLLSDIRAIATRLLGAFLSGPADLPDPAEHSKANNFCIGFITPPFKDNKIPVTDHLHAHAFIGSPDLAGWWRAVAYSSVSWYSLDDLMAEIKESTTNNRVKSGYENRPLAPIDMVPSAGSKEGGADGVETTLPSLANPMRHIEDGQC
ncbi:hypothetical protein CPB83DRAFT_872404 [Crepidotus variabilis]|uniref:HIT domain-containing protein n=1 Tax=Crepidotus variabilis TaxID=179855 RepID=A0A9P6EV65_9AGAR|nr:hypothetical protein CPB83DRAFT_872404 [Crepidotus variabilis]